MAITSQFLTDFQNYFTAGKRSKLLKQNLYNTSHHTFNMLPQYLAKFEVRICVNLKKKSKNRVTFDKNRNVSCHMAEYYHL